MPAKKTTNNTGSNGVNGAAELIAEPLAKETVTNTQKKVLLKSQSEPILDSLDEKELLTVLMEVRNGNFSVRMPIDRVGMSGKICDTLNDIISTNERMIREFTKAGN